MKTIVIEMPYINNLSVNSYRLSSRKGSTYSIKNSVKGWMVELARKVSVYQGLVQTPVFVTVSGTFKNKASEPDMHNLDKVLCDALEMGLKLNDRSFRFRVGTVNYSSKDPVLKIVLEGE